jgi:hypothetical protein
MSSLAHKEAAFFKAAFLFFALPEKIVTFARRFCKPYFHEGTCN